MTGMTRRAPKASWPRRNFPGSRRLEPVGAPRTGAVLPRLLAALFVLLIFPATAHAGWIAAAPIDGPSADVIEVGGVDLARDGSGAIAYLRNDGGAPHVFVARLADGAFRAPERVDPGTGSATEVKVAVGDGNRL